MMKRVIGYICEGPRDIEMLSAIVDRLYPGDNNIIRVLQPEGGGTSANYTGWKGVFRWCNKDWETVEKANAFGITYDLLIIQVDGDVSRDEDSRQSHCACKKWECMDRESIEMNGTIHFEDCRVKTENCPISLPCDNHTGEFPDNYVLHLKEIINGRVRVKNTIPYVVVVPCDNTDAWIVAANGDETYKNIEMIENPWNNVIAKESTYMGVRVRKDKKQKDTYGSLIKKVTENWGIVTERCIYAKKFEEELRKQLGWK